MEGLSTQGVLEAIRRYPELMEPVFTLGGAKVTLDAPKQLADVNWSEVASNRYNAELETYAAWLDYLEVVEGICYTVINVTKLRKHLHYCKWLYMTTTTPIVHCLLKKVFVCMSANNGLWLYIGEALYYERLLIIQSKCSYILLVNVCCCALLTFHSRLLL